MFCVVGSSVFAAVNTRHEPGMYFTISNTVMSQKGSVMQENRQFGPIGRSD
jgi:hypothetical protein